jgi:hypothetical protein
MAKGKREPRRAAGSPRQGRPRAASAGAAAGGHLLPAEGALLLSYLPIHQQEKLVHLAGCPACQRLLLTLFEAPPAPEPRPAARAEVEQLNRLAAALDEAAARMEAQGDAAEEAVAALLATAPGRRRARIRKEPRFHTLAVACRLLHHSVYAPPTAPEEEEGFAILALLALEAMEHDEASDLIVGEVTARAWGLVARARWSREDWTGVRRALDYAEAALVEQGYLVRHLGFRPALRTLRLLERRFEEAYVTAAHALGLLLEPLLAQIPGSPATAAEEPSSNDGGAAGPLRSRPADDMEN